MDLSCDKGGEFKTILNTDVFLNVWKRLISDGNFKRHDWSVKVDADSVFFPARLRALVAGFTETPNGVYLNNCKFGLHGPVEVLSKNAVQSWGNGMETCVQHFKELCSGPCL